MVRFAWVAAGALVCAGAAQGQRATPMGGPGTVSDPANIANMAMMPVTVTVNVREANGMLLEEHAFVKLSSGQSRKYSQSLATQDNSSATFVDVVRGDYDVEVSSAGYKTAHEHVSLVGGSTSYPVFIYLHPESEEGLSVKPPARPVITAKLQQEMDKGMEKLRKQQYDAARQHFEKAAKLSPSNADLQYLLGMIESRQKRYAPARAKFEKALELDPTHERSLLALGEMQLQTGDADGALRTLERAFAVNGADWRTHYLLAQAYRNVKDYRKAEEHASRATELGKSKGAAPLLLLGRIYEEDRKKDMAKRAFELLVKDFPGDATATEAKSELAALAAMPAGEATGGGTLPSSATNTPVAAAAAAATGFADELPLSVFTERAWGPPDVDAKEYALASGVTCKAPEVVARAQQRMLDEMGNFEKFMATEEIEHQQVDRMGNEGPVRAKEFSYLVFVRPYRNNSFFLEESRNGGMGVDAFPTNLATTGLVGLGVALLEREYENDFEYTCEGLSSWRGQAAWQVRFEQKKGIESRVRVWRRGGALFPVPLKGRVWLAANSYDLLHLESDLREPVQKLALVRDHLMIDYGPVTFENGKKKLWLPWKAEMYMEQHGRRYHHRHTLTDYALFSVDTTNQIGKPKEAAEQPEKEEKPPS